MIELIYIASIRVVMNLIFELVAKGLALN